MPIVHHARTPRYSGFIIVRLTPGLPLRDTENLREYADHNGLHGLVSVLDVFNLDATRPVVLSLTPIQILNLERVAVRSPFPPLHSLNSYWRIDARRLGDRIGSAIGRLDALAEVDLAYEEFAVTQPCALADGDPYLGEQGYLDHAPLGIDAHWAWQQSDGRGDQVGFVDVEQGWSLRHKDYESRMPVLIYGDNRAEVADYYGEHGTMTLGVVCAEPNGVGVIGIARDLLSVRLSSHYDRTADTDLHVADAVVAAIPDMKIGDVMLLEVSRDEKPTEIDHADFDAIRLTSALGLIVVEAAGNRGATLDDYVDPSTGAKILNTGDPGFRDSGAVMVGAAAIPSHDQWEESNYGSRVTCHAWGAGIVTCGGGDLDNGGGDPDMSYTRNYGNTSGASAIVAGAAIVLQGKYKAAGTPLSPGQMRWLLATYGTPQGAGGHIGVMPDLRELFGALLLAPDVYVRDNLTDDGMVPSTGTISLSPDIIVRPDMVANPDAAFGEGSGTEDSMILGNEVEADRDHFVYVRMRNRGTTDAAGATATVYWSEVATLVTPDLWHEIGTTGPITVPEGDAPVVAGPAIWPAPKIPGSGHYCFVAAVDQPQDPRPPLPPGPPDFDFDLFRAYVRNQNNVTWRNFNVVDPIGSGGQAQLQALINGPPDCERPFDLEIVRRLPERAAVWIELPMALAAKLGLNHFTEHKIDRTRARARVRLPARPRLRLSGVTLGRRARYRVRFIVTGAAGMKRGGHSIALRQLYQEQEVGRVTWMFRPLRRP